MCGRTALSLCAEDVRGACSYLPAGEREYVRPAWQDEHNLGRQYAPSCNVAPSEVTPVLVAASGFGVGPPGEQVLKPMMWGMVPPWHKGDYRRHGLSTNNCRLEGLISSRLYGSCLRSGNRCVVVAEGYYEWQTTQDHKQPHYVYSPQGETVKIEDVATWGNAFSPELGWQGVRLLQMAGLYDSWRGEEEEEGILYSYSIITKEADEQLGWLHHRMPAFLETPQQVQDWLDTDRVPAQDALSLLQPARKLCWHPVSTAVNNSRNKSEECNKPAEPNALKAEGKKDKGKSLGSVSLMSSWLKGSPSKRSRQQEGSSQDAKKLKTDD